MTRAQGNGSHEQDRADVALVRLGLARSRQQAQELIELGVVYLGNDKIEKPSHPVPAVAGGELRLLSHPLQDYVSRAALKIKGAVETLGLRVAGLHALDIGISTGGFSDYLLQNGVRDIVGIDVGHGQLAEKLKSVQNLKLVEGFNARELTPAALRDRGLRSRFDLIVIDVSFISLSLVLPVCPALLSYRGHVLALVKPQFEVGREGLGKDGVVKGPQNYKTVEEKIRAVCKSSRLEIQGYFDSQIEGFDGNREFFIYAKRP